jgi:AcrR family transcriptional regulator
MSQIAKEAGVSIGIIYHYFASKTDLLNSLYIKTLTDYRSYVLSRITNDIPTEKKLKQMFLHIMRYYMAHSEEFSFSQQYENSPFILAETHQEVLKLLAPVLEIFADAREGQILKDLPVDVLVQLSFDAVVSLAKIYLSEPEKLNEEILNSGLNAIWDMIKKN